MTREAGTPALRRMRWWDLAGVAPLEAQLFGATAWTAETLWSELAAPGRCYLVAEAGGDLLGYAGLAVVGATADVQTVAAAPAARGRGVGAALLDALLAHAAAAGAVEVLLEVEAGNDSALRLYGRAGFERIALRRGYYGPGADAVIMRRRLRRPAGGPDRGAEACV